MYRVPAAPSTESLDTAAATASQLASRARALTLAACLALGVATGLLALDRLQEWAHVFALAYGSAGLGAGWVLYRLAALPALRRLHARCVAGLAARHGVPAAELDWTASYLG